MSVTTTLAACSTIVANNGPDGTIDPPSTLDDAIRYSLSFVATLRDTKAPLASPALTGVPTAPTPVTTDNSTTVATTAYVKAAVVAGQSGVATFNSRAGAVTLAGSDVSGAGGALSATLSASSGASLIGFTRAETGAVARTEQDKLRDTVSVKDFGALGDGTTDDTAAMQAAHNTGRLIYYPAGTYKFSTISFAAGGIIGDGPGLTLLNSTDATTANLVTFTGTGGTSAIPTFDNFLLQAVNTKTAGAALRVVPSSGELSYLRISRLTVYNAPRCVHLTSCIYGSLTNSYLLNYTDVGIYYEETVNAAAGDFLIQGNHINTGQASGNRIGIAQASGGGLRIIGNKILGGLSGFALQYNGTVASGPLLINSNSIENCVNFGIYLSALSTGTFGGIEIVGNEIAAITGASGICISSDTLGKLSQITVAGNHLAFNGATGTGISLNTVSGFHISANTIVGNSAAGNSGITTTVGCANGKIGKHTFVNIPSTATTISNASTTVFLDGDIQAGSVNIAHTTAFGTLFYGSAAITFPTPYSVAPQVVTCNAGGGAGVAGGFGGYATNISKTGFTYNLVGVTSGTTNTNLWSAQGVI